MTSSGLKWPSETSRRRSRCSRWMFGLVCGQNETPFASNIHCARSSWPSAKRFPLSSFRKSSESCSNRSSCICWPWATNKFHPEGSRVSPKLSDWWHRCSLQGKSRVTSKWSGATKKGGNEQTWVCLPNPGTCELPYWNVCKVSPGSMQAFVVGWTHESVEHFNRLLHLQ